MISVCIATYNGKQYIHEQLLSILPQLTKNDEIIISDDGSSDGTLEIVRNLHSPLIQIYSNNGVHGYTSNFENAIRHAKGDVLFICDQDDVWKPNKVEVCMELLRRYDMVVSDATITDENLTPIEPSFFASRGVYCSLLGNIYKFGYLGCCMAFRRQVLKKALPFPENRTFCTHDNWLFLVSMCYFRTHITSEKLVLYRRHQHNTSSGNFNKHEPALFRIKYRLYLIKHLIYRGFKRK